MATQISSILLAVTTVLVGAACGGPSTPTQPPMSVSDHYAEADVHDAEAAREEKAAATSDPAQTVTRCGDQGAGAVSTSGGERLSSQFPCWTTQMDPGAAHQARAERQRLAAAQHRKAAAELVRAEQAACAPIAEAQREHSPSWHRDDVLKATPLLAGDKVVGATLLFRKVDGLSEDWLLADYLCVQAQAAAEGFAPSFMSYCPAALEGVSVEVREYAAGFEVTLRSAAPDTASIVWARAKALLP